MRTDQDFGMTVEATMFLRANVDVDECKTCQRPYPEKTEEVGYYDGMFGDKYPLYRHFLKDGRTADEFLQASPWSSGPCFFIGLKVSDGTEFLWPQDEIDKA